MTAQDIMAELKTMGSESVKKIWLKHGIKEPFFGVKIQDLKTVQKKIKKDYRLAKELYATGNTDAMYLAGLIADENKMTKADLNAWVKQAVSTNISEYTVPWIAAESDFGFELGMEWIDDKKEFIAAAGWSTLGSVASIRPDNELDIAAFEKLLTRVHKNIHQSGNRVRNAMNLFVIAIGSYIPALTEKAIDAAGKIGVVMVDKEGTACKVPDAAEYIIKVKNKGLTGKKKKMARC